MNSIQVIDSNTIHLNLSINSLAFYWSFPEIVAIEYGYYKDEGLDVEIHDVTPKTKVSNKSEMYMGLQKKGFADAYHAAEWVSITRVVNSPESRIVAWSPWLDDALNASFGLYFKPESGITEPKDLDGKLIVVEGGTGSYYTTIEDLERYISRKRIMLKKVGDPNERLVAVWSGEVSAASLLGVYADIATHIGLSKVMDSKRRKGTLMVAKNDIDAQTLRHFINGTNRAIRTINDNPDEIRRLYFERFKRILTRLPDEIMTMGLELKDRINIPKWSEWQVYPKEEFTESYQWMVERDMVDYGYNYENLVDLRAFDGD